MRFVKPSKEALKRSSDINLLMGLSCFKLYKRFWLNTSCFPWRTCLCMAEFNGLQINSSAPKLSTCIPHACRLTLIATTALKSAILMPASYRATQQLAPGQACFWITLWFLVGLESNCSSKPFILYPWRVSVGSRSSSCYDSTDPTSSAEIGFSPVRYAAASECIRADCQ